jgi:hypothetical protein
LSTSKRTVFRSKILNGNMDEILSKLDHFNPIVSLWSSLRGEADKTAIRVV